MNTSSPPAGWDRYYRVLARIPKGRVTTYGALARMAGTPRAARHVGFALAALHGRAHDLPWHRVLGARGPGFAAVSLTDDAGGKTQRAKLAREGVRFDARGRVALDRFGWTGSAPKRRGT
jgi:methylated-DNA-protein-cysteine methyltransferase-like protein